MNRILIIKHGALGDVIRTSYFLKPLYEQYGYPEIYWFTSKSSFPLLRFNPFIFQITYEIDDLLSIYFDWVISLDDEFEILKIITKLEFAKITGAFIKGENRTYSEDSSLWFDMGLISNFGKEKADELKKMNKKSHVDIFSRILKITDIKPFFFNSQIIEQNVIENQACSNFVIGINTGAGGRWESKKITISETIKLVNELLLKKYNGKKPFILLLGGKEDESRNREILKSIGENQFVKIADSKDSLLKFAAIIKACDYVITSDSLALHLAISQHILNLSFYAPTSACEIDTFGTGVKVISTSKDYCNYSSQCDNSTITSDRILNSIINHLHCNE